MSTLDKANKLEALLSDVRAARSSFQLQAERLYNESRHNADDDCYCHVDDDHANDTCCTMARRHMASWRVDLEQRIELVTLSASSPAQASARATFKSHKSSITMPIGKFFKGLKDKLMLQFLTKFLAQFIDKLKVSNPTVFLIIQVVIGVLIYLSDSCIDWLALCGTDAFGTWAGEIKAILIGLGLTLSARTTRYLDK